VVEIIVKEVPIEEAVKVSATVVEFKKQSTKEEFEERYQGKDHLIIVAYVDDQPAGYSVGYNRYDDGSFFCWMAGVDPKFRRQGVFKSLMEYQEKWAEQKGYNKIRITSRNNRREMLIYLVKHGFNFIKVDTREIIEENRVFLEKSI